MIARADRAEHERDFSEVGGRPLFVGSRGRGGPRTRSAIRCWGVGAGRRAEGHRGKPLAFVLDQSLNSQWSTQVSIKEDVFGDGMLFHLRSAWMPDAGRTAIRSPSTSRFRRRRPRANKTCTSSQTRASTASSGTSSDGARRVTATDAGTRASVSGYTGSSPRQGWAAHFAAKSRPSLGGCVPAL